jgi:AcrR family transcriptional regulator
MHEVIKKPLQNRSRFTANNILNALDSLLREKDLEHISIQEISTISDAAISSIYARFADKHAMVLALHQKVIDDAMNFLEKMKEIDRKAVPLQGLIKLAIVHYLAFARKHQHIYRAAILSNDNLIYERVISQIRFASELFYKEAQKYKELGKRGLEKKVDFSIRMVVATLQQTWVMNTITPARFDFDDDELASELAKMVFLYITGK